MGEFWRYQERDGAAFPAGPVKRPRNDDYAAENQYGLSSWRDPGGAAAGYGRNGAAYGDPGLTGSDIAGRPVASAYGRNGAGYGDPGLTGSDLAGRPVASGYGGLVGSGAGLGLSTLGDTYQAGRLGFDSALGNPSLGLGSGSMLDYGAPQETAVRQGSSSVPFSDMSSTLFVEGIAADCTKREAAHIFRPFVGFKEVRLVLKESKRPGGVPLNLCFVDFIDARSAAVAREALQGYKFDESEPNSHALKLEFARVKGPSKGPRDDVNRFRGPRR